MLIVAARTVRLFGQQFHEFTPQDWKLVLNNPPCDFVVHLRVPVNDLVAKAAFSLQAA
jgi:hypothetical protein